LAETFGEHIACRDVHTHDIHRRMPPNDILPEGDYARAASFYDKMIQTKPIRYIFKRIKQSPENL
jgi:hypothetical protein